MEIAFLYVIVLLHTAFAGVFFFFNWQYPNRFSRLFALCWAVEGVRAAILLPAIHNIGGWPSVWYSLGDVLCFVANWCLLAGFADLVEVRLPRWLAPAYFWTSVPLVLFSRFVLAGLLHVRMGLPVAQADLDCVFLNMVVLFVPVTAARLVILAWLYGLWRRTRMTGALIAAVFAVPYAVVAAMAPLEFWLHYWVSYHPDWIAFLWCGRVLGFSIGLVILMFDREHAAVKESGAGMAVAQALARLGSWQFDPATGTGTWSDEMFRLCGRDPARRAPDHAEFLALIHPDDRAALEAAESLAPGSGDQSEAHLRTNPASGPMRYLHMIVRPVRDRAGRLLHLAGTVQDETERKRAEFALVESEARYRFLFENNPAPMGIYDCDTLQILAVNEACVRHYGYSREEALGLRLTDLYPEEEKRRIAALVPTLHGYTNVGEWHHRRRDGSLITVVTTSHDINYGGRRARVAVLTDITERKLAEERLKESEAKLRALFEGSAYPMGLAKNGIQIMVNPAYVELFGYATPAAMIGTSLFNDIAPDERPRLQEFARRRREGDPVPRFYETRGIKRDGTEFDMAVGISTYEVNGEVYTIGILRDISAHKLAEKKVLEQAALLDTANDAIYVTALDCTIRYWNRGAERTYGWTSAEALGRKTTELLSPDPAAAETLARAMLQLKSWSGERPQRTKSGQKVEVFSRLTLVHNEQGEPQAIFAINTDITERKQLEAQFLRAQRLESIGALASGIAHDLNNVLAPIIIGMPLLQNLVKDQTARHLLKTMETSAQRGAAIVKQVLTFARGVEGERVPVQPRHLLQEIEKLAGETFPKDIRVDSDLAADLRLVLGDATQLHQAVMNLCINARDAMPEGGVLTLKAANVVLPKEVAEKMAGAQPGSYVCLRITDTGAGIPPEIQTKIFEPFFTTKGVGKGTGLGLSTVLGIVRSHGGFVQVASTVGAGSTFELYLPATTTEQAAAGKESATPWPRANGEGILVVDDEAAVREVARQALMEFGYQVIAAGRGAEALTIFRERRREIQLVLTDMMMPEMDGPTLIAALRALEPTVRIVGITGLSDTAAMGQLQTLALSAILAKPFTIEKLLAVIREALPAPVGHDRAAPDGAGTRPAPTGGD